MDIYKREKSEPLEQRLKNFYEKNDINFLPGDDIFEVCRSLGFSVWKIPLDEERLDGLILVQGAKKRIGLNQSLDLREARFVLAHELSHYISEYFANQDTELLVAIRDRVLHGNKKAAEEQDMDYLAAAILVPKEPFMLDLKGYNIDLKAFVEKKEEKVKAEVSPRIIEALSTKYCVAEPVILRRIVEVAYYAE